MRKSEMTSRNPQQGEPKYAFCMGNASIPLLWKAKEAADAQKRNVVTQPQIGIAKVYVLYSKSQHSCVENVFVDWMYVDD